MKAAASVLTAATVATALLAGCTHGSSEGADAKASIRAGSSTPAPPKADNIVNDPRARPSVSMKDCGATSSGWSAGGTVTNVKNKVTTYTIVVSFTTKESTVLARGTTQVAVKAHATKKWTANANFAKTKGTLCVLRGVSQN